MKKQDGVREIKYRIGKYILRLLEQDGEISHEQFTAFRDELIAKYSPVIGELEKGEKCGNTQN